MRREVCVERDVERSRGIRRRTPSQVSSRRGKIERFSKPSRRRFIFHVRNCPSLVSWATLTYPDPAPTDGSTTFGHIDLLRRWAARKKIGIVWRMEFDAGGRPHFHAFFTADVPESALRSRWTKIVGCKESPNLVRCGPIRDREDTEWYTLKEYRHPSNRVPDGFRNMGRWWGCGGPGSRPVELLVIEGEEKAVADVVRLAKRAQKARVEQEGKVKKPRRKDNGVTGFHLYGGGGQSMADGLARYAESVEPGLVKPLTEAEEKNPFPDETGAREMPTDEK